MPANKPPKTEADIERELVETLHKIFLETHDFIGLPGETVPTKERILKGLRQLREEHRAKQQRQANGEKAWAQWGQKITGNE